MEYKYLFGPVPSRRLGISLGIDLIPLKTCNFNCIYCECGDGAPLYNERKEYIEADEVLKELKEYLSKNSKPEYITFSGSGEPTLNSRIGYLIQEIKKLTDVKICVITNSTNLVNKNMREELRNADLVMPSLNAVLEKSFLKINRPNVNIKLSEIIEGIRKFGDEFQGEIYLEIFMIDEINYSKEELEEFVKILKTIKFTKVQLNSLDRPAPVSWVKPMAMEKLETIKNYFKENHLLESIWKPTYQNKNKDVKQYQLYRDICLEMISDDRFQKIYDESIKQLGFDRDITKMRVLENLFFTFGKN